ncbi:MAG: anti-sigma factor antagonist [Bryobacteraceae bacterium]|jgi:anti-anti-sigma factor
MALDIVSSVDGNTARIALTGELDGSTAPALRTEVDQVLSGKPAQLVLQVEHLSFMASAGLRILIFAKQKLPTLKIYLVKPQPAIVDTLHKTGFFDGVYVTDTEPASA